MKKRTWNWVQAGTAGALSALLLAGCASVSAATVRQAAQDRWTPQEVETVVLQELQTPATVTEHEYDREDGVYELELHTADTEYEVEVHAETGTILHKEEEPRRTADAAAETAPELPADPTAVKDYEEEYEDGVKEIEYEVNGLEYEIETDPKTGEVLKTETEPADDPKPEKPAAKPETKPELPADPAAVKDYEEEYEDGVKEIEYEVNGLEYEVETDPKTGEVLKIETEPVDNPKPEKPQTAAKKIGSAAAKAKALESVNLTEAQVRDLDCELDDGFYEVEFEANGIEYEFKIHAESGEIVKAWQEKDD